MRERVSGVSRVSICIRSCMKSEEGREEIASMKVGIIDITDVNDPAGGVVF